MICAAAISSSRIILVRGQSLTLVDCAAASATVLWTLEILGGSQRLEHVSVLASEPVLTLLVIHTLCNGRAAAASIILVTPSPAASAVTGEVLATAPLLPPDRELQLPLLRPAFSNLQPTAAPGSRGAPRPGRVLAAGLYTGALHVVWAEPQPLLSGAVGWRLATAYNQLSNVLTTEPGKHFRVSVGGAMARPEFDARGRGCHLPDPPQCTLLRLPSTPPPPLSGPFDPTCRCLTGSGVCGPEPR